MSREYDLLSEINERLVRMETKMEVIPSIQAQVKEHGDDILRVKTTVRLAKWVGGAFLATMAAVAGVFKAFH